MSAEQDKPMEPFEVVGDDALEARVVAWVLGEASEFETEELQRLCKEQPELEVFRRRTEELHGLAREGLQKPQTDWKLPAEKRQKVLAVVGTAKREKRRERSSRLAARRVLLAAAACLALTVIVTALVFPIFFGARAWKSGSAEAVQSPTIVTYSGSGRAPADEVAQRGDAVVNHSMPVKPSSGEGMVSLPTELPAERIEGTPRRIVLPDMAGAEAPAVERLARTKGPAPVAEPAPSPDAMLSNRSSRVTKTKPAAPAPSRPRSNTTYFASPKAEAERPTAEKKATPADAGGGSGSGVPGEPPRGGLKKDLSQLQDLQGARASGRVGFGYTNLDEGGEVADGRLKLGELAEKQKSIPADGTVVPHAGQPLTATVRAGTEVSFDSKVPELGDVPVTGALFKNGETQQAGERERLRRGSELAGEDDGKGRDVSVGGMITGLRSGDAAIDRASIDGILTDGEALSSNGPAVVAPGGDGWKRSGGLSDGDGVAAAGPGGKPADQPKSGLTHEGADDAFHRAANDETRAKLLTEVDASWEFAVPEEEGRKENKKGGKDGLAQREEPRWQNERFDAGYYDEHKSKSLSAMDGDENGDVSADTFAKAVAGNALAKSESTVTRDFTTAEDDAWTDADSGNVGARDAERDTLPGPVADPRGSTEEQAEQAGKDMDFRWGTDQQPTAEPESAVRKLRSQIAYDGGFANGTVLREPAEQGAVATHSDGAAYQVDKLQSSIIPKIDFEDTSLEEAVDFLPQRAVELDSMELDPTQKGLNLNIRRPAIASGLDLAGGAGLGLGLEEQILAVVPKVPPAEQAIDLMAEMSAADEPFSTFSLHVSDASFRLAAAALERGERPDPETVRPEEFYNAFDYGDPGPTAGEPVACAIEQCAHPLLPSRNLVRVGVRTAAAGRGAGQALRLTVLLDNSGSMERADRRAAVEAAMEQLGSLLGPQDVITVAGFARQPRLLVDRLSGENVREQLRGLVEQTPAEGGTNLEQALALADELAMRQFDKGAQNRIVLLTDGAANLGNADPEQLAERVEGLRQRGVSFDAAGFGTAGLNDRMLERLTRDGNGRYYVVDGPEDAGEQFARKLAGAFRPAAENVKVQVRFNPARVGGYRLIGFEEHRLKKEDFRDDSVDAAEMAAEEAGVAVYQVELLAGGEGEIGEVFVRFRDASKGKMVERSWTMQHDESAPGFDRAPASMQVAGVALLAADALRDGPLAPLTDWGELAPVVNQVRTEFGGSEKVGQLLQMVERLRE